MVNIPRRDGGVLCPRASSDTGLSHSVNLGMSFFLKMICYEEEVSLMPVKDGSASRARLVDGGCHSLFSKR